jgi:hypothetical protein
MLTTGHIITVPVPHQSSLFHVTEDNVNRRHIIMMPAPLQHSHRTTLKATQIAGFPAPLCKADQKTLRFPSPYCIRVRSIFIASEAER